MSGPQASVDRVPEKLGADLVKAFLAEPVGSPFFGGPDHVGFLAGEEELRVPARGEVEDELPPRVLGCRQSFHDVHPLEVQGRGAPSPLPHGRIRRYRHLGAEVGNEKDSTLLVTLKQSGQTDRVRDVDDGGKASVVGAWRGGRRMMQRLKQVSSWCNGGVIRRSGRLMVPVIPSRSSG